MARWMVAAVAAMAAVQDSNSYKGKEPPEITIPENGWINAKKPITLAGLKGRVVWLEFSFIK
jgi:hypothetical protein